MNWRHSEFQDGRPLHSRSFRITQVMQQRTMTARQGYESRYLRDRWLTLARIGLLAATGLIMFLFIDGATIFYDQVRTPCTGPVCQEWQRADFTGVSPRFVASWNVGREVIVFLFFVALAAVLVWRAGNTWMALLGAFAFVSFGGAVYPDSAVALARSDSWLRLPELGAGFLGAVAFFAFLLLFPDGRFVPQWTSFMLVGWVGLCLFGYFSPRDAPLNSDGDRFFLLALGMVCLTVAAQIYRYQKVSSEDQRQQTKWVILGVATAFAGLFTAALALPRIGTDIIADRRLFALVGMTIASGFILLIPLSFLLALLRFRLWEADRVMKRALVYGALTAIVIAIYAIIVGLAGALMPASKGRAVPVLAAVVIALVLQPLRARLERTVNRLLYGERDEPYAVISRLGQRLEGTFAHDAVLTTIVETVSTALRLPYVAIALRHEDTFRVVASHGAATDDTVLWPLTYGHENIGQFFASPRSAGESFSVADRRLLDDVARQSGIALQALRLTSDLEQANRRLISVRREERQRLRRDLHDGLGPHLASQTLILDAARRLMPSDPATADELLNHLQRHMQTAVDDVRGLVNSLRPASLGELGLAEALKEEAAAFRYTGLEINVCAVVALGDLPAPVEVAAYRVAMEAMTNVVRHAGARTCEVTLALNEPAGLLRLDVADDGVGLPSDHHRGVGLTSMYERTIELGGHWSIEPRPDGGTLVWATFPIDMDRR